MIEPPSGRPAAMAIDEYPVNVPISSTAVAWAAKTSSSRNRPSCRPTIIPQAGNSLRVDSSTAARCGPGAVECSSAYASTSGRMSGSIPLHGTPGLWRPGAGFRARDGRTSIPDLSPQADQSLHVEDVGIEERHGHQNVGRPLQLVLLLRLPAGHNAEVQEAL